MRKEEEGMGNMRGTLVWRQKRAELLGIFLGGVLKTLDKKKGGVCRVNGMV